MRTQGKIVVRPAGPEHSSGVAALHQMTLQDHIKREFQFDTKRPFIAPFLVATASKGRRLRDRLFGVEHKLMVAEQNDELAGHLAYTIYYKVGKPFAAFVADITVAPAHRRSGVGRALVKEMERRERDRGLDAIAATVWPLNTTSLEFFHDLGFAAPLT